MRRLLAKLQALVYDMEECAGKRCSECDKLRLGGSGVGVGAVISSSTITVAYNVYQLALPLGD